MKVVSTGVAGHRPALTDSSGCHGKTLRWQRGGRGPRDVRVLVPSPVAVVRYRHVPGVF